jgi:CRP-like cAMP-binding protein
MEDLLQSLGRHPFLQGLGDEHLRRLASFARGCDLPPGARIFRAGEEADALYLLLAGRVALEQHVPGQGPVLVESLRDGDLLGLSWFFAPYEWHLDARAVEPVRACVLAAPALRRAMDQDPALGYALARRLLEALYARLERVRLQRLDVYRSRP